MTDNQTYLDMKQRATNAERERDELKSTLRDHFAAAVITGELAAQDGRESGKQTGLALRHNYAAIATNAYAMADAMLAARKATS